MQNKNLIAVFIILLMAFCVIGCGIEDYPYLDPIPQSNVTQEMNNGAVVRIPNTYSGTPFSHFAVFYRIYVSDIPQASTTVSSYQAINPTLASDYNSFSNYIDSTTQVNVNMDSLFSGRGYKYLSLMNYAINSILSSSVLGNSIRFDFSSSKNPTMIIGSNTYTLWRAEGNGYTPQPDRYFRNKEDLSKSENISSTINADVVSKSGIVDGTRRYTYTAMFIAAVGINPVTMTYIYSTPSLIHVFQLPD